MIAYDSKSDNMLCVAHDRNCSRHKSYDTCISLLKIVCNFYSLLLVKLISKITKIINLHSRKSTFAAISMLVFRILIEMEVLFLKFTWGKPF